MVSTYTCKTQSSMHSDAFFPFAKLKFNHPSKLHRGVGRTDSIAGSTAGDGSDQASMVSAYTYKTQSSLQSKSSQPDFLSIPAEYERVSS